MTKTVTPAGWNDPATAPKDGTMVHLLIQPGQEELDAFTSFHDSRDPYETIGFNQLSDTTIDEWQFAGWDWCHDCITDGHGEVIGWLPFGKKPSTETKAVCAECHGTGEVFGHADDCRDDLCALNGDIHSCEGKIEPCGCQSPESQKQGVTPEAEARDAGISFGIAMSVAFLIRDRDEPSLAREWWDAAGLTIEQCERVGLDDYDLAPIRAALASEGQADA